MRVRFIQQFVKQFEPQSLKVPLNLLQTFDYGLGCLRASGYCWIVVLYTFKE